VAILKLIAYLSLPVIALRYLASRYPKARYHIRVVLYMSTMGVCSIWGVFVSVVMGLFGNRFDINYIVARSFYNLASSIISIRFIVQGEEHLDLRPAILVGNHQSMLDILYLGRIFPRHAAIMAKKELQWMPLLGQYMALSGAVFIDRSNNKSAVHALNDAGSKLKAQNTSLWLFPEGTRSMREQPDMLPFKKGAFHLAVQSGLPVIPVICENYWRLYRKGVFDTGTLTIRVLPPIPTKDMTAADVQDLMTHTRNIMLDALRDISAPSPSISSIPIITHPQQDPLQGAIPDPIIPLNEPELEVSGNIRKRTMSAISAAAKSDAGAETEEDEGMVLVGRP